MGCEYASGDSIRPLPFEGAALLERRNAHLDCRGLAERWAPARPTIVFETYWRFAAERQAVFFNRLKKQEPPWTDDPILRRHRFTNVYRILDRVSQYLVQNVIYGAPRSCEETFFRTILFKLFNKIETWQLLLAEVGDPCWASFDFAAYDKALSAALRRGRRIYSAAYVMPSGKKVFGHARKHRNHLKLLQMMMKDRLPDRISRAATMQDVFELLKACPSIGDFLAYQFATDINYSEITDFSEMDFVVPGPGSRDGIHKCFTDLGGLNEVEMIKRVAERQEEELTLRGIRYPLLPSRPLQLIDCQNLFCEVDKYARIAHPEVTGVSRRRRIKQVFRPNPEPIDYFFPPKWGLSDKALGMAERLPPGEVEGIAGEQSDG